MTAMHGWLKALLAVFPLGRKNVVEEEEEEEEEEEDEDISFIMDPVFLK
jgi:hypothetical protein